MKVLTNNLSGTSLDYAVAIAEGIPKKELRLPRYKTDSLFRYTLDEDGNLDGRYMTGPDLLFSRKWEAAGPIIEREKISLKCRHSVLYEDDSRWFATGDSDVNDPSTGETGRTPLEAAMRCYVASKLGDSVEIPDEICK